MSWSTHPSGRRQALPPDWPAIRRAVLTRDGHRCRIQGPRCTTKASDVDHTGHPDDHRPGSLRAACGPCHAHRSGSQGGFAPRVSHRRPTAAHPGLLGPSVTQSPEAHPS